MRNNTSQLLVDLSGLSKLSATYTREQSKLKLGGSSWSIDPVMFSFTSPMLLDCVGRTPTYIQLQLLDGARDRELKQVRCPRLDRHAPTPSAPRDPRFKAL